MGAPTTKPTKGADMNNETKYLSGAEFKLHFAQLLRELKDNDQVTFGSGDLSLYRLKDRSPINGPRIVQIEFNETYTITSD
jgi:hypothetical protein